MVAGSGVMGTDMACAMARASVVSWNVEDALQTSAERIKKEAGQTDGIEYRKVDLMNEAEMFTAIDAAGYSCILKHLGI
jgi:3-hydroxyacyl-CoA dehydrogenase